MRKLSLPLALAAGTLLYGAVAWAGTWADFEAAFPTFPCQDGWAACVVDGKPLHPDLQPGGTGMPQPADLRVGWDLQPTASFSPFVGLSAYTGELPKAPEPPPEPVAANKDPEPPPEPEGIADADPVAEPTPDRPERPEPTQPDRPTSAGQADAGQTGTQKDRPGSADATTTGATGATARVEPTTTTTAPTTTSGSVRPTNATSTSSSTTSTPPATASTTAAATAQKERPGSSGTAEPATTPTTGTSSVRPTNTTTTAPSGTSDSIQVAAKTTPTAPQDDSCDNLTKLEPQAMLGKLSEGQIGCLEKSFSGASKMTDKEKISRVLMANAYSKGDTKGWEKLAKRHLEEVDQSDPDIAYKYALQLAKGGAPRANGTIRWANVALENRHVWTGDTYTTRVYSLYKLRAVAAQSLWEAAEKEHAATPSDDTKNKVDKERNQTKVFAREWYEYAKQAGKDTTLPMQLCVSAAGTKDYCEAG